MIEALATTVVFRLKKSQRDKLNRYCEQQGKRASEILRDLIEGLPEGVSGSLREDNV